MAHNLNFRHGRASMMYVGSKPWHSFGTKVDHVATSAEAIEAAQHFTATETRMFELMEVENVY